MLINLAHLESCLSFIQNNQQHIRLVYYSHIPSAVISLLVGFFVFFKNQKYLVSKILLSISITFSLWALSNLIIWTSVDSKKIMFAWSLSNILDPIFFVFSLYFLYVFIDKKDVSFVVKIILGILLTPVIILASTQYNLIGFDVTNCEAKEFDYFTIYLFFVEIVISLWIIALSIYKYFKIDKPLRKQLILLTIGIILFLSSFSTASYIADLTGNYRLEIYGLFGMTIFMGFLAYLIVRFKAFNIKLLATQALVAAMIILIASQFAFIQNFTNKILTGITLILSLVGGWMLVKSVNLEVERKEQLQKMTDQLAMANDQLRKLDNAKSEFISIASHQLRTPLAAVKGYASLMLEGSYGKLPVKQRDILNKMYQSNERLIALVEDILNLSRIESGRMEYKFEKVKIEGVLDEIFDTFILKARDRHLELNFIKNEKPLPEVMTDRNKIREVISNFVDNAIKYTPSGSVTIKSYEKDGKVTVAVADTGIGVAEDEMASLFKKFSRGKNVNRLNVGGTGLGLHVGIKMIKELKGRIWVESEGEGKGSTFFVEIPVNLPD